MKIGHYGRKIALAIASCAFVASISISSRADETFQFFPDHYLSYDIKTATLKKHHVKLRDQFISWTDFIVRKPIKLLNPTLKRHNNKVYEIKNPPLHYTAFELEQDQDVYINHPVVAINQFGSFLLEEFRPSRLLAPSRKKELTMLDASVDSIISQQVALADHYLCYEIPPVTIGNEFGFLKDQFRSRVFETLVARHFCNPVAKIHDDQRFDIVNDVQSNHLMCFEMDKQRILRLVALLNQFGLKKAWVVRDDELCVPTFKIELPRECEGSSPGEDGICNGSCPKPNDICQVDPATQACSCFPEQPRHCFDTVPDSDGVCNGVCPNTTEICVADATGSCYCLPTEPTPCFDTVPGDNGQCDGFCPQGEVCVVNPDQKCECRPQTPSCGFTTTGQCGGDCPPEEKCTIIPGTNSCGCILG